MQLRERSDAIKIARDMHQFVRDNTKLADEQFYVMLYCCSSASSIAITLLPPGTVIVPVEAVKQLLFPFGLNKLVVVADDKSKKCP